MQAQNFMRVEEVAQELGITSAVAALPEVLDAAGELGIRN